MIVENIFTFEYDYDVNIAIASCIVVTIVSYLFRYVP